MISMSLSHTEAAILSAMNISFNQHAADIAHNCEVPTGSLYTTLDRLEKKRFIFSTKKPERTESKYKPRRRYNLTDLGYKILNFYEVEVKQKKHG